MSDSNPKFDFFVFGSTSQIIGELISKHRDYFEQHVRNFHLVQRGNEVPAAFSGFDNVTVDIADCADAEAFEAQLETIVSTHAQKDIPMHVFSTYGIFNLDVQSKKPRFEFSRDGLQINLNSRLQIIEAFRSFADNTRFHLFGSLFASFPYMGGYPASMWYMNNVVGDPANKLYNSLDIVVHNLGGMKTKFWWSEEQGHEPNPFIYEEIPTDAILRHGFTRRRDGGEVYTEYPSLLSRVLTFFGRRGLKPMDLQ